MTWQALIWFLLGAALLICIGILLGATWTAQALRPKLCELAAERQQLNEEWAAVRAARRQRDECPRCGYPLADRDWGLSHQPLMEGTSEDD